MQSQTDRRTDRQTYWRHRDQRVNERSCYVQHDRQNMTNIEFNTCFNMVISISGLSHQLVRDLLLLLIFTFFAELATYHVKRQRRRSAVAVIADRTTYDVYGIDDPRYSCRSLAGIALVSTHFTLSNWSALIPVGVISERCVSCQIFRRALTLAVFGG